VPLPKVLTRTVPLWALILAVSVTATVVSVAIASQAPPVREVVNVLRPKIVEVKVTDATLISVTLEDLDEPPDGKANDAVVVVSFDGPVDKRVKVTVTLYDDKGNLLDSGSTTGTQGAAATVPVYVRLNNKATMKDVKSIVIVFEQVTG
jgi:hypothetical protein